MQNWFNIHNFSPVLWNLFYLTSHCLPQIIITWASRRGVQQFRKRRKNTIRLPQIHRETRIMHLSGSRWCIKISWLMRVWFFLLLPYSSTSTSSSSSYFLIYNKSMVLLRSSLMTVVGLLFFYLKEIKSSISVCFH